MQNLNPNNSLMSLHYCQKANNDTLPNILKAHYKSRFCMK